jgi:anthranilate synthase component 2
MLVLIVDNNDSFTFNLKQQLEQSELCEYDIVNVDELDLDEIENYDKILISPGPGLPNENPLLKKLIQEYKSTKSILGVCLGLQAIVENFGGELYNLNEPVHGIKSKNNIIEKDEIYNGLPNEFNVGLYHSWAVSKNNFPSDLLVTSNLENGVIMSVKHKKYDVRGIQFHPESIMTEYGQQIIINLRLKIKHTAEKLS